MKVRDHYDWIVLGNHPGALLSASLAAKLGLSVLILPFGFSLPSKRSGKGQVFDPESNLIFGLCQGGMTPGIVLQCLGLSQVDPEVMTSMEMDGRERPQVLTPHARVVLEANDLLNWEIKREFGSDAAGLLGLGEALEFHESDLRSYWSQLPKGLGLGNPPAVGSQIPRYSLHQDLEELRKRLLLKIKTLGKQKIKKSTHSKPHSDGPQLINSKSIQAAWLSERETAKQFAERLSIPEFTQVTEGFYSGLTSTQGMDPSLFNLLLVLSLSRTGASFKGGVSAYREFLIKHALELGVHYSVQSQCKRIFIEDNQFLGVQISGAGNMISGRIGVLGCSMSRIEGYMPKDEGSWFRSARSKRPQQSCPVGWKFTLSISIHREAIPEKMQSHVFWQEKDAPYLEIEIDEGVGYRNTESENQIVFLRTILPFHVETLEPNYQRRIAGRMFRQATELMPFLEFHVTQVYPDFRASSPAVRSLLRAHSSGGLENESFEKDELSQLYGFPSLEAIPDSLLCYSGRGLGPHTGVQKLYLASDESYPSFGSFGGVIAALQAVSEATGRSNLK